MAHALCSSAARGFPLRENSRAFGPEHWQTISFYDDLGGVYFADSRFDKAEEMYKCALHGREKALGPMHPLTHDVAFHLGRLYHYLNQSQAVEEMYSRAFHGRDLHFGLKSRLTQKTLQSLGTLYIEDANYQHAERLNLTTQSQAVREIREARLIDIVCYSEAETMYKQVIRGYQKAVGMKHGDTLMAERHFALFLANSGRLLSALQMFLTCKEHYELFHPDDDEPHCKDEIETVGTRGSFLKNLMNNSVLRGPERPSNYRHCAESLGHDKPFRECSLGCRQVIRTRSLLKPSPMQN
ncbi:hypothetical protein AC579_5829 [Pseudocercospora musae]|uniref:MalT-like TPR region domain-containing protein n=1 Tax=Pseudocercospora musae TaxID=113226 RepID=A0A139IM61_9PEZI|nr:hypothetical protein AC579_5829 [Pseudocercospora musae]